MMRMRTIKQAYLYIQEQDRETALTESTFKRIVKSGLIPTLTVSPRIKLINLDDVDAFLQNANVTDIEDKTKQEIKGKGEIRKQEINVQAL